jgi:hypothetical protein
MVGFDFFRAIKTENVAKLKRQAHLNYNIRIHNLTQKRIEMFYYWKKIGNKVRGHSTVTFYGFTYANRKAKRDQIQNYIAYNFAASSPEALPKNILDEDKTPGEAKRLLTQNLKCKWTFIIGELEAGKMAVGLPFSER